MPKSTIRKSLVYDITVVLFIVLLLRNFVRPATGVPGNTRGAVPFRYRHLLFLGRRNLKCVFN
jgi:hypothetical protein